MINEWRMIKKENTDKKLRDEVRRSQENSPHFERNFSSCERINTYTDTHTHIREVRDRIVYFLFKCATSKYIYSARE